RRAEARRQAGMPGPTKRLLSGKRGELDHFVLRNSFEGKAGLAPGAQASGDDGNVVALLLEDARYLFAGGFAKARAVENNGAVLRDIRRDRLIQGVRFEALGALNA